MSWWNRMARSLAAFRRAYTASDAVHEAEYASVEARQSRYVQYWAAYENQAYSRVHTWSQAYRHQYALYKYIRNLYNPAFRLGDFYAAHLFGGALDREAAEAGCIPIQTDNEALRVAIAELWQRSNMSVLKDVIALRGAVEGDVFLRIVDDVTKQRVYLDRLDPGLVTECDFDHQGNVKGYTVEENRPSPESRAGTAKYKLIVSRSGPYVVYQTFKGNSPYGWDGQPAEWKEPYTFVPLVLIQHHDVGLDWGWSELHPLRSKVHEVDELASMLSDHIRKHLSPVWLGKGGSGDLSTRSATADESGGTNTRPQPGREEIDVIWGGPDAEIEPLIAELDIEHSLGHLQGLLKELERDYPELQEDIWSVGATSGRALRVARQRIETKVLQRREGYDSGLVRAQMMAVAIGGMRGIYPGFNIESYEAGALDHSIAARPVFEPDPMDATEEANAFWEAAGKATKAGMPLESYLRSMGWSDEQISEADLGSAAEQAPVGQETNDGETD